HGRPPPGARTLPRPGRVHGRTDREGARRWVDEAAPRSRRRTLLRGQLWRWDRRLGDAAIGEEVPVHESAVRPCRVPGRRLGADGRIRREEARPESDDRWWDAVPVPVGDGGTD